MSKIDMSATCGLGQITMKNKRMSGEISEEQFVAWYDSHCGKCIYEHIVCMYGEFDPDDTMVFERCI